MSFYGNSYNYLLETFTRVVISNAGLNKSEFSSSLDEDQRDIDATKASAGIEIKSGNRWVGLEPIKKEGTYQGFKIFHNAPATDGDNLIQIVPDAITYQPSLDKGDGATKLNFLDYIKIPVIQYDQAGHVSATNDIFYFQMPENPAEDFIGRMNDIDGKDNKPDTSSLKYQLLKRMNDIDGKDNGSNDTSSLKYEIMSTLAEKERVIDEKVSALSDMESNVNKLYKVVVTGDTEENLYSSLVSRVSILEQAVGV